jgi:23S rRNA pseudouridine1911/1915/1917 synthase
MGVSAKIVAKLFDIVHEDDEFLVINKPSGLVCHPTKTDEYSSLISRVRLYLGAGTKPQLINRLDRETSGITCVAKNGDVARKARRLWENREATKEYVAIVHGHVAKAHDIIIAALGKDERSGVAIKDRVREDGAQASTEVWLEKSFSRSYIGGAGLKVDNNTRGEVAFSRDFSLLKVVPHTGRKHQIRIHLAHVGHPIVGDKLYGGNEDLYLALVEDRLTDQQRRELILPYHALHASLVRFEWRGEQRVFRAEPERWFKAFCSSEAVPV